MPRRIDRAGRRTHLHGHRQRRTRSNWVVGGLVDSHWLKALDRKWFLAVDCQVPVGQQIFVMDFDPGNDQFVFVRRQFTGQKRAIKKSVTATWRLVVGMNVGHMMAFNAHKDIRMSNP